MLIDLHTHTQPLSHDSLLTPDQLIQAAKAAGLDAVCLTEHDFVWDPEMVRQLARRHAFTVIPAIEVNTEDGHFLAFGLDRYVYGMHRAAELARLVDEAGGALVAAHPYRRQLPPDGGPLRASASGHGREASAWSEALDHAAANPAYRYVCALETLNSRGRERENQFSQQLCDRLGLPAVAASDAHQASDLGRCATEFQRAVADVADLIRELKAGRCRPVVLK
ncbi:MAG: PHP domain-containing protein [Chloroflexi bacterium]|nr:PHP domain-containing protein [Chloroflexota bacterium]